MSDWQCMSCRFVVYGHKDFCSKCGQRRPLQNWVHQYSSSAPRALNTGRLLQSNSDPPEYYPDPVPEPSRPSEEYRKNIHEVSEQVFDIKDKLTDNEFKTLLDGLKKCHDAAPVGATHGRVENVPIPETRPEPRQNNSQRPRDWMCTNCNFKIFGSKNRCNKCGQHRP